MATHSSAAARETKNPSEAPRGGGGGWGTSPSSDVGGGVGGRDARGRGCAPSRPGRLFIQKARSLRGRPCARGAGPRRRVSPGAGLLELPRAGR